MLMLAAVAVADIDIMLLAYAGAATMPILLPICCY